MSPAEVLAGYRLEERVGVGGMAEVYRAQRLGPGGFAKQVAVKRVLPDLGRDSTFLQMFLDEARLQAQLSSPGLVQVFDFGQEAGTYYLVMEYVDGVDLAALLHTVGPLEPALAVHLGRQLSAALADVHRAVGTDGLPLGIVHRDVTPGNVLCGRDGHVKLGDFGVAKARARSVRTERGAVKGKLAYLAPEQVRGDEVDARTDLYALGLVLFEALTGTRYLDAPGEPELWRLAGAPTFRAPSTLAPRVPATLDEVLRRALQPAPEQRFPSAALLEEALAAVAPPLGPDAARRQLGALVDRARLCTMAEGAAVAATLPLEPPASAAPPAPAGPAPAPTAMPAASVRPPTEVIDPAERPRGTAPVARWRLIALSGGLLIVAVAIGVYVVPTAAPSAGPAPLPAAREVAAPAPAAAPRPALATSQPAASAPATPKAADPSRKASSAMPRGPRAPGGTVAGAPATVVPSGPVALPPGPTAAPSAADLSAARDRLAEMDRILAQRGVLAADAPRLFATRRALATRLARGEAPSAEIDALVAHAQAFTLDRAFITTKLERLNHAMAARDLLPEVQQRVRRHSQEALSHTLTGRYDQANRELNAIARLLER
jgi:eukaryotic-like serine/threonine-protein kinase